MHTTRDVNGMSKVWVVALSYPTPQVFTKENFNI